MIFLNLFLFKKKKEGKDGIFLRSRNINILEMIGEYFFGNKYLNY